MVRLMLRALILGYFMLVASRSLAMPAIPSAHAGSVTEPDAERTLSDVVLTRLAAMRLIRRIHRRDVVEVIPLPAIHRFALATPDAEPRASRPARRARR